MQKIIPHLWFDDDAEAAMARYADLIPGSSLGPVTQYPKAGTELHGRSEGSVMTAEATLAGTRVVGLNGGPHFTFTPAISMFVVLDDRTVVDRLWEGLTEGGEVLMPLEKYFWSERYGWVADRWGLTWQIMLVSEPWTEVMPMLMFTGGVTGQAGAAIDAYTALFPDSDVEEMQRYGHDGPGAEGDVMHARFRLAGSRLMAMDSAVDHDFGFSEAVSLMVECENQAELDRLWAGLSAVPEAEQCGWLKDAFGVSWQIVPRGLTALLGRETAERERVMAELLKMKKLDFSLLASEESGPEGERA